MGFEQWYEKYADYFDGDYVVARAIYDDAFWSGYDQCDSEVLDNSK